MSSEFTPAFAGQLDPVAYERRWKILGVLCLSLFLVVVDNLIINVALPTLQRELDADISSLQWIVDSYSLVFAGLLLACGGLGDRFGRKRVMQIGLVLFGSFSAWASFTNSTSMLILTRGLMGFGAALVFPSTLAVVIDLFREPVERAKAIGAWSAVSGAAVAFGPLAGGLLLEHFWWGSVFLINVPIVIVALLLGGRLIPESRDPNAHRIDWPGFVLSTATVSLLVWTVIEGPHRGWTSPRSILGYVGVVVLGSLFVWRERMTDEPLLDVTLFRNMRLTAASVSISISFFALFGFTFLVTQYFQFVRGYSTLQAGLHTLPFAFGTGITAPIAARLALRFGTKRIVTLGLIDISLGLAWASTLDAKSAYFGPVIGSMVLLAHGLGLVMSPSSESVMGSLPREKAGVGSAINDTTREIGGTIGVAVVGSVFSSLYGPKIVSLLGSIPAIPKEAIAAAKDSAGAAYAIADGAPTPEARAVVRGYVSDAFMHGFFSACLTASGMALLGAFLAWRFLPARAADHPGQPHEVAAAGGAA